MGGRSENRQNGLGSLNGIGIKPYYARQGVALYHAECMELLTRLQADSIDALVTDPPYCSGAATIAGKSARPEEKYCQSGNTCGRPSFSGDHLDQRSFRYWCMTWIRLACSATKAGGYAMVFSDWRQLPSITDAVQAGGFVWRGIVPWDKGRGARAPHTGYFRQQSEYVAWGTKGPCLKAHGRGPFEGVISASVRRGEKLHITGKSLLGMRQLVKAVPPGGLILDPFAGSSTTLLAAALEGRRAIGIEREESYCEISAERLERVIGEGLPAAA